MFEPMFGTHRKLCCNFSAELDPYVLVHFLQTAMAEDRDRSPHLRAVSQCIAISVIRRLPATNMVEGDSMTTVRQLLEEKGHEVYSIHPDASVFEAIREMAIKDVGSLVVIEGDDIAGMFTERHYARKVFLEGKSTPKTPIRDIMTSHVICAPPDQTVEQCMAIMSENRIRHLPVLDEDRLVGIVSIGDLVKSIIADQNFEIKQLTHFVRG